MKVFLLGGTGAIGRHALRSLVAEGHSVTALARTPEKAADIGTDGAEAVTVSMSERARRDTRDALASQSDRD